MKNRIRLGVVTVCWNAREHLEECIQSVISQEGGVDEYWVIDGGSSDGTLGIIKKYEESLTGWISEPDGGIADAMNKGWQRLNVDYILFLHADDYFVDMHVLENIRKDLRGATLDIYLFDIFYGLPGTFVRRRSSGFIPWLNVKTTVWHQGSWCSKNLLARLGGFDTSFKIAMDYDFFLRAYQNGAKARSINKIISCMRSTGVSSKQDWLSIKNRLGEEKKAHDKNVRSYSWRTFYVFWWLFYPIYKRAALYIKNCCAI